MSSPVPGWYPDPTAPSQLRYWDGSQWTEHAASPAQPAAYPFTYGLPNAAPVPASEYGMGFGIRYAHWGLRVAAALIDGLITVPITFAASIIEQQNTTQTVDAFGNVTTTTSTGALTIYVILEIAALAISLWNTCYRQGTTGYSLGKQAVGIKLVKDQTGQPIGGWLAFGRQFLHILDVLSLLLGYLWPLWDKKRQTFADKLVGSVVIVEPKTKA